MTTSRTPNAEHRFFAYDPEGEGLLYYSSAKERDDAMHALAGELNVMTEWQGVEFISIGEVTHVMNVANAECIIVPIGDAGC